MARSIQSISAMKIALCLTGLARCWEAAYPNIKKYILDVYDTDVFFTTWSEIGYYTGKGYLPEQNGYVVTKENERGFHEGGELIDAIRVYELYNPKVLHIENFSHFEPYVEERKAYFKNAWTRPKNTISQAYMMYRGIQQIHMYNQIHNQSYDVVIRTRPDILFEQPLPELNSHTFWTLAARNKHGQGTGDWLQIGNLEEVTRFTEYFYLNLESMYNRHNVSCPHLFVQQAIEDINIQNWQEFLIKANMLHSPNGPYQEPI